MRYIETTLIALFFLMFVLKEITFSFAGIGFSLFAGLLALFYLTSKFHIFRNKEFNVGITLISSIILFISVISLLLFLNNWIESIKPLLTLLIIQILWFVYLIFKKKPYKKELSKRIGITAFIFSLFVSYVYLASCLGKDIFL